MTTVHPPMPQCTGQPGKTEEPDLGDGVGERRRGQEVGEGCPEQGENCESGCRDEQGGNRGGGGELGEEMTAGVHEVCGFVRLGPVWLDSRRRAAFREAGRSSCHILPNAVQI